jgi:hypothetical protein
MLCAAAAAMALTATAEAATTPGAQVDQSSVSTVNDSNGLISEFHASSGSQTFTAGTSGQLSDVTVDVYNEFGSAGDLRVAVNPVDGVGDPNPVVELAVSTVSVASLSTSVPASVDFVFTAPAILVAGTSYAITLTQINSAAHQHVWWAGSNGDTYAGGEPSDTIGFSSGDFAFATYMIGASSPSQARAGYCSVAGNTWQDGSAISPGTFLNLADGQPAAGHYKGATSAYYLEGLGISCRVPAGYVATDESVGFYGHGDPGLYPYFRKIQ